MRNTVLLIAAFFALAGLSACGNSVRGAFDTRQNIGPCPPAGSVFDAARIVTLDGNGERYENITYTGEITDVRLFCRYAGGDPIDAELEIDFAFGRGPAGASVTHTYSYFVTVTRRNAKVLARQEYDIRGEFDDGRLDAKRETIRDITIPRADETISGANFEVLVGFVLTDEELQFNRDGKRFRLDAQVE